MFLTVFGSRVLLLCREKVRGRGEMQRSRSRHYLPLPRKYFRPAAPPWRGSEPERFFFNLLEAVGGLSLGGRPCRWAGSDSSRSLGAQSGLVDATILNRSQALAVPAGSSHSWALVS